MGPESGTPGGLTRFVAVFWATLLITASVPVVTGAHDGSSEQDPRAAAIGPGEDAPGPAELAVPADRNATTLAAAAQSGPDGPSCGKAPGSVSGEAVPVWVDFVCTASSNESSAFRIEMRQAWVYVVKIQAPQDASASQIVNGTTQTLFRHGLPETEIGVWPPVLQQFGKQPGEVTIIMNGGSALDNSAGSWSEVGVWDTVPSQKAVELNPGVYEVRVVAIEPFVTEAETLQGLSPEEMTQLAVSGGERKTGTVVLESSGCVAGYDPHAHLDTLEQQAADLREKLERLRGEFDRLAQEFGVSMGVLAASLAGAPTSAAAAVEMVAPAGSATAMAASRADTIMDVLSAIEGANAISRAKRLANRIIQSQRELNRNLRQQHQVLDDINRCAGGQYTARAPGAG